MTIPHKVCIWATTFTADIWSFSRHLDQQDEFQLLIVLNQPDRYREEAVFRLLPFRSRLLPRSDPDLIRQVKAFQPEVVLVDNHLPAKKVADRLLVLWHGFGWKGPNDIQEFATLHRQIRKQVGDGTRPNPHFVWQCFSEWDFLHRTRVSGFAPENCRILGSAFSDSLLTIPVDKNQVAGDYPGLDLVGRPTVLFAPTWHYGRVFGHWGQDLDLLEDLFLHLDRIGANLIVRFHDRDRYPVGYLDAIEELARRHPRTLLKFKDTCQDNFVDLKVSDVVVSNFSSILNHAYILGKPTVHIYPVPSSEQPFRWRVYSRGKVREKTVESAGMIWKLPLEQNGGLMVYSFNELIKSISFAICKPDCCIKKSAEFVEKYIEKPDGNTGNRIQIELLALLHR